MYVQACQGIQCMKTNQEGSAAGIGIDRSLYMEAGGIERKN